MAQVVIEVDGRPYTMQCQAGEEDHLRELAALLNSEVSGIKKAVGQVGDIRLLMMAGLVIADKLSDAARRIEDLQDQLQGMRETRSSTARQNMMADEGLAGRIGSAAERMNSLVAQLEASETGQTGSQT